MKSLDGVSFKLPAIEQISKIIGDYFTGYEITGLFKKSGHPEIAHDGGTKWRFLASIFEDSQKNESGKTLILDLLESSCDPQEFFERQESHSKILDRMNNVLSSYGLKINEKGKITEIKEKRDSHHIDEENNDELNTVENKKKWDVFVSHASENKVTVAAPLVSRLRNMGLSVWYDESNLTWGKSLRKSIDEGLANSLFGIVVLSKDFFKKKWTQIELDGLISIMTTTDDDNILPLRYEISNEEVAKISPVLAGIFSRSWDEGVEKLAQDVCSLVTSKTKDSDSAVQEPTSPELVDQEFKKEFDKKMSYLVQQLDSKSYSVDINDLIDVLIMLIRERIEKWDTPSIKYAVDEMFVKLYPHSEGEWLNEMYPIFKDLFSLAYSKRPHLLGVILSVFNDHPIQVLDGF